MFNMLSTIFCHKLKLINSMFYNKLKCLMDHVMTVLCNPCFQLSLIYNRANEHNIFKIATQPEVIRTELWSSWTPVYWKITTDNSSVSKISLEQLYRRLYNVRERSILHENVFIKTCRQLKCWNDLVALKTLMAFTIDTIGKVKGPAEPISWKNNVPTIINAVDPHLCRMKLYWCMYV